MGDAMQKIGLWHVSERGPGRLDAAVVNLERNLEEWIEKDPSMLQAGLVVVGRQIWTEAGPLDLLAVDPQGRWVLIEIKRGSLHRETAAQALDYASCIGSMPYGSLLDALIEKWKERGNDPAALTDILRTRGADEPSENSRRDISIMLVGTGISQGLDRMVGYLADRHDIPIELISFQVFALPDGQQVMVRELKDADFVASSSESSAGTSRSVEGIARMAAASGVGEAFEAVRELARKHGLYARAYKKCVMYTPPQNRTRCLFAAWSDHVVYGPMTLYVYSRAFAEFFDVSEEQALSTLGVDRYINGREPGAVQKFIADLDRLFELAASNEAGTT